jgi:hypothetical protein
MSHTLELYEESNQTKEKFINHVKQKKTINSLTLK